MTEKISHDIPFFPFMFVDKEKEQIPFPFYLRKGELTVVSGYSNFDNQILMLETALYLANKGIAVAVMGTEQEAVELQFRALKLTFWRSWLRKGQFRKCRNLVELINFAKAGESLLDGGTKPEVIFIPSIESLNLEENDPNEVVERLRELSHDGNLHICLFMTFGEFDEAFTTQYMRVREAFFPLDNLADLVDNFLLFYQTEKTKESDPSLALAVGKQANDPWIGAIPLAFTKYETLTEFKE